eukprot:TRINITY_DN991_c0_g1_i1.p1 TRINITY_DN991_c0_g1~~TRINITY_DN991_c0_g1_i1.p1  ORF type:complete len:610 (-),score=231.12 TRINITY_DN991_c0_g1_i1:341-2170(-)
MSFWQENLPFIKGFFDERSTKFLELMDNAEKSIEQVNADQIYTSKQFKRIKDNFQNIVKNLERQEVRDWLQNTRDILTEEKKGNAGDDKLAQIFARFEGLTPRVNETKLVTDMLWKSYEFTDDLVPLMEFTTEQYGLATREVFSGSVSQTEEIIEKHTKVMDKLDKKKKDVKDIIAKGEKLAGEAKAPAFLGEKLAEMKKLWSNTNNEAKQRLDDLKVNTGCWNTFAEKCALLQTHVTTAQKQIDDVKKLYDMPRAKEDFKERTDKATSIKASVEKTFNDVCEANDVLQVLADEDVKVQLKQEVEDLKTAAEVSKALDDKLAWLDEFNKNIIDYNKICTDLEAIVVKDRADLDALIKPAAVMKFTDRLVSAMDLADDIRAQVEIASAKQQLWDQGLAPEGKENTPEAKEFVKRMDEVAAKLAALVKESDGEAAKYGQDIVLLAAFNNAQKTFTSWIDGAEAKCKAGYGSPNNLEESATMVADCKAWKEMCEKVDTTLESGKASAQKMTLHDEQDKLYTEMKARWTEVDKSCKEWTKKLEELSGMWTKQTEMLNKVTSTMVTGDAGAGEQVNLNELDAQMEQIKDMFVKKQEMMKKMSTNVAPDPAQLAA